MSQGFTPRELAHHIAGAALGRAMQEFLRGENLVAWGQLTDEQRIEVNTAVSAWSTLHFVLTDTEERSLKHYQHQHVLKLLTEIQRAWSNPEHGFTCGCPAVLDKLAIDERTLFPLIDGGGTCR